MENSIEEAIERLEYIDRTYSCNNYYCVWDLKCIETLLSEYKRLQKENEELKEKRKKKNIEPVLIGNKMYFIDESLYEDLLNDIKNNYIPVQKIKDKIEELENANWYCESVKNQTIEALKELLEESEGKRKDNNEYA